MTAGELKKRLQGVPDNAVVAIACGESEPALRTFMAIGNLHPLYLALCFAPDKTTWGKTPIEALAVSIVVMPADHKSVGEPLIKE